MWGNIGANILKIWRICSCYVFGLLASSLFQLFCEAIWVLFQEVIFGEVTVNSVMMPLQKQNKHTV